MLKKIVVIDNSPDVTGALKAIVATADDLEGTRQGLFEFVFVLPSGSKGVAWVIQRGYRVYELPFVEIRKHVWSLVRYVPMLVVNSVRLARIVVREKASLVHVNDFFNWVPVLVRLCLCRRIPLVTHIRMPIELRPMWLYKVWSVVAAYTADEVVAVSRANTRHLPKDRKGVVVYDRIPDMEKLPRYEPRDQPLIQILYLANYIQNKGQLYALQVADNLREAGIANFEIHFYGSDMGLAKNKAYKQYLCTAIDEAHLSGVCKVQNAIADVEAVMKKYDIALNFSDGESFSRVNLEAMFFGVPLITTSVGGTSEMLVPNKTAILVPPKDISAMTSAVKTLLQNYTLRQALSNASYAYVRTAFGKENTSDAIEAIYKNKIK